MIDYYDDFDMGGIDIPSNESNWAGGFGHGGYGGFGGWGSRGSSPINTGYRGYNAAYWGMGNFGGGWPHRGQPKFIPADYNACYDWYYDDDSEN